MADAGERRSRLVTDAPQSVTFVELFFDLVFVFALTQITSLLHHDLTWTGTGHAAIVLWLVWWAWTQFTWTLNPADTEHVVVRLLTLVAMGAAFFMAQAVPDAFVDGGPWFALSYVVIRLLGLGLQVEATWGSSYFAGARLFTGISLVGLAFIVIGGFVDGSGRVMWWLAAMGIDVVGALRAGRRQWSINVEHFSERHGLIVIIALGESLIAAGVGVADTIRGPEFALGAAAAVVLTSAAWWIYFASTHGIAEQRLHAATGADRAAVARDVYSFGHLPILAGIIAIAVAVEAVMAHPGDELGKPLLMALVAGSAVYVGTVAWIRKVAGGEAPLVAMLVVAGIVAGALLLHGASGLVSFIVVIAGIVVYAVYTDRAARSAH